MIPPPSWLRTTHSTAPARGWLWVMVGLAAVLTTVFVQFADSPGFLEQGASWWRVVITLPVYLILLLAWWQLGPRWSHPVLTAVVWSAPMLFAFPMHSRDVYAYAAQGWIVAQGLDPYMTRLGSAGMPGLLVGVHWHETTSVYPALSLELFGWIAQLTGSHPYWTTVVMRLPNLLALAILVIVVPALARRFRVDEAMALWAGVLNPIMLIQWIGGVHNDALMVALASAALLAATDLGWRGWRGLVIAGLLLGLAMGFKQSAALFGLGVVAVAWSVRHPRERGWARLALVAILPGLFTVATFLLTSLRLGLGWRNATAGNPISAESNAPFSWLAMAMRTFMPAHIANGIVQVASTMFIAAVIGWLWFRYGPKGHSTGRPWPFALAVLVAFSALAPAMQPWYLTWLVPLYVFTRMGARWNRGWLVVLIAFTILPVLQDVISPYGSMALLAVPLWLAWRRWAEVRFDPFPITVRDDAGVARMRPRADTRVVSDQ